MENATKALMMAGGVLLALLVISLLVYAWGSFSDYYDNQSSLSDIEDLTEFNLQFTNYDRDDVMGYEIISLMNKVVDYNNTSSTLDAADSNDAYDPIEMIVNGASSGGWTALTFGSLEIYIGADETSGTTYKYGNTNGDPLLFEKTTYYVGLDNSTNTSTYLTNTLYLDTLISSITGWSNSTMGSDTVATNVAKSMSSIALTLSQLKYNLTYNGMTFAESYNNAIQTYNSLTGSTSYATTDLTTTNTNIYTEYTNMIRDLCGDTSSGATVHTNSILAYYEYYQFKRGIFTCDKIDYDSDTGRVSSIEFTFTGEIE